MVAMDFTAFGGGTLKCSYIEHLNFKKNLTYKSRKRKDKVYLCTLHYLCIQLGSLFVFFSRKNSQLHSRD